MYNTSILYVFLEKRGKGQWEMNRQMRRQYLKQAKKDKALPQDLTNLKLDFLPVNRPLHNTSMREDMQQQTTDMKQEILPEMEIPITNLPPSPSSPPKRGRKRKNNLDPSTGTLDPSSGDKAPKQAVVSHKRLIGELSALYATLGMAVSAVDTYTGALLIQRAEQRASELVAVAKHHPGMLKMLSQVTAGNDYIACIIGHGTMLYAVMAHFGQLPKHPILTDLGLSESQVLGIERTSETEDYTTNQQNGVVAGI